MASAEEELFYEQLKKKGMTGNKNPLTSITVGGYWDNRTQDEKDFIKRIGYTSFNDTKQFEDLYKADVENRTSTMKKKNEEDVAAIKILAAGKPSTSGRSGTIAASKSPESFLGSFNFGGKKTMLGE